MNTAKLPRVSFANSQPHLFPQKTEDTQRGIIWAILSTCLCYRFLFGCFSLPHPEPSHPRIINHELRK